MVDRNKQVASYMWHNQKLVVYHGTYDGALSVPISLALCRPATDFGQGFYTTTHVHQARQWANEKTRERIARGIAATAAVYRFALDRNDLADLEWLVFPRPVRDFWTFVTACRGGASDHARWTSSPPEPIYDIVVGPVTLWPQTLTINNCDQISFHTPQSLALLHITSPTTPRNGPYF